MPTKFPMDLRERGTYRRGEVDISGTITITAAGAVASVACEMAPAITGTAGTAGTILKDAAAGRYNVVLGRKFKNLRFVSCALLNPSATVAQGNVNGNALTFRPSASSVTGQTFTLQAFLASTGADTDVITGTVISFLVKAQLT